MLAKPISICALWENFWVFTLYGFGLGIGIGVMSKLDIDLTKAHELMMEPLSFYAFSALSMIGLLALCITNQVSARDAKAMHSSCLVRNVWVPITNAGLATGAIIMGMMCGLAIGLTCSSWPNPEVQKLIKVLFALSAFVLALLYPFTWLQLSLFDSSKEEERTSGIAGILYCVVLGFAFYHIDRNKFWYFITIFGVLSLSVWWLIQRYSKKRDKE